MKRSKDPTELNTSFSPLISLSLDASAEQFVARLDTKSKPTGIAQKRSTVRATQTPLQIPLSRTRREETRRGCGLAIVLVYGNSYVEKRKHTDQKVTKFLLYRNSNEPAERRPEPKWLKE